MEISEYIISGRYTQNNQGNVRFLDSSIPAFPFLGKGPIAAAFRARYTGKVWEERRNSG